MKVRYKHGLNSRQGADLTVGGAVVFECNNSDPEIAHKDTAALLGRLVHTLHKKGLLLPDEVITVLGSSYERTE